MTYITYSSKYRTCPKWKEKIYIRGKYRFSNNPDTPYEARFLTAECPIVENIKLPAHEKDKTYSLFPFCDIKDCSALKDFKEKIDVRKS